jgi:hypothetical protein
MIWPDRPLPPPEPRCHFAGADDEEEEERLSGGTPHEAPQPIYCFVCDELAADCCPACWLRFHAAEHVSLAEAREAHEWHGGIILQVPCGLLWRCEEDDDLERWRSEPYLDLLDHFEWWDETRLPRWLTPSVREGFGEIILGLRRVAELLEEFEARDPGEVAYHQGLRLARSPTRRARVLAWIAEAEQLLGRLLGPRRRARRRREAAADDARYRRQVAAVSCDRCGRRVPLGSDPHLCLECLRAGGPDGE